MQVAIGAIIAGKYELERPLARGGMGSVWVARHVKLGSRLAVKFLEPRFASSPSFIERFEREARAAAALQSPHVVHVQDYGVEETTPYLVMELLQGEDLATRLRRVKRLPLQETGTLVVQIGKALRKAHDAGIVHRDLKPANLFLMRVDEDEILKVLDFGIAKETASVTGTETKTGEVMGSPHYMSPEQARADKGIDHRADLWSLGVIIYECVTGARPFDGVVLGAVLSRILVDPVPPVASFAPDLTPALDRFFARAMAKSKEDRFQSAREIVDAFVAIAGGPRPSLGSSVALTASVASLAPQMRSAPSPNIEVASSNAPAGADAASAGRVPAEDGAKPAGSAVSISPQATVPLLSPPAPSPPPNSPSTLTNASTANAHALRPRPNGRSVVSWIAAVTAVVGLIAAGIVLFGVLRTDRNQTQSATENASRTMPVAAPEPSTAPSAGTTATGTDVAPSPAPPSKETSTVVQPTTPPAASVKSEVRPEQPPGPAASASTSKPAVQPGAAKAKGKDEWGF